MKNSYYRFFGTVVSYCVYLQVRKIMHCKVAMQSESRISSSRKEDNETRLPVMFKDLQSIDSNELSPEDIQDLNYVRLIFSNFQFCKYVDINKNLSGCWSF